MKHTLFFLLLTLAFNAFGSHFYGGGGGGGSSAWGGITGTLSSQTDLQAALDLKAPLTSPTLSNLTTTGTTLGLNIGTTANGGDGKTFTVGNSIIRTGDGQANQLGIYIPNGGQFYAYENSQQIFTLSAASANWGAFAAGRDWTMQWQMGKGVSHYGKGVSLGYSTDTTVGNVGAGEDDLQSKTVQGNSLATDGDRLEVDMWFTTGTGNTKTFKVYEDATLLHTVTTTADSATGFVHCDYARTGAATGNYFCRSVIGTATATSSGTLTDTHTTTMVWKGTGESSDSTTDDIQQKWLTVKHMKVGN